MTTRVPPHGTTAAGSTSSLAMMATIVTIKPTTRAINAYDSLNRQLCVALYFGVSDEAYRAPSSIQASKSASASYPFAPTTTQPIMGLPVMSNGLT